MNQSHHQSQFTIHLVGFGSQGNAWAQCLRTSGWQVQVYLPSRQRSYQKAMDLGFTPHLLNALPEAVRNPEETHWIAMMCPDSAIPTIYGDFLSGTQAPLRLVLAHGYAVFSGELHNRSPLHRPVLLAPKAIGPKLLQNFNQHYPQPHSLVAAISEMDAHSEDAEHLRKLARGLGFDANALVTATFEQETVGDLISEQGLLCGGVFNLIQWTMDAMAEAGIPDELIREECITELELIASMVRSRGLGTTFQSISQAAQCGTIAVREMLEASGYPTKFSEQVKAIRDKRFVDFFNRGEWKKSAEALTHRLEQWEERLAK